MGQLKKELKMATIDAGTTNWVPFLREAVDNWNESYSEPLHGSPMDVVQHPETRFLNMQDNARKFAHNRQNEARMEEAIMRTGRFRPPVIRKEGFRNRVFSRRFGAPQQADHWESGVIVDTTGKEHTLKLLQPLGRDRRQQPEADPPVLCGRFRGLRREVRDEPARPRRGPRLGRRAVDVAAEAPPGRAPEVVDLSQPAPAPREVLELPVDPEQRLQLMRKYRGLLIKGNFRAVSDADKEFVEKWRLVMPKTDWQLKKAMKEAEAAKAELARGPGRPR